MKFEISSPSSSTNDLFTTLKSFAEANAGAVLLAATAAAIVLIVSFVGVLQSAVDRGELRRQQQYSAANATLPSALPTSMVMARSGR